LLSNYKILYIKAVTMLYTQHIVHIIYTFLGVFTCSIFVYKMACLLRLIIYTKTCKPKQRYTHTNTKKTKKPKNQHAAQMALLAKRPQRRTYQQIS